MTRKHARSVVARGRWLLCAANVWLALSLHAHVPVPDSVLDPQNAPEAWNVLRLALANIDRLVDENRLTEVTDQASLCGPALRRLARLAEGTAGAQETNVKIVRASSVVGSLAQECIAGDRPGITTALRKLHAAMDALAAGTDPRVVNAEIFLCPMHPDVLASDTDARCPKCGMPLTPRRIAYSFVYVAPPGEPLLRLTAVSDTPPTTGRPTHVRVRLTKRDGSPVDAADLLVAHTQRIHLLVVDPALEDYHHEHPVATGTPGEYEFAFTPAKTSTYRIFADLVPSLTGVQEYDANDLPGAATPDARALPLASRASTFADEVGGIRFGLTLETPNGMPPRARQTTVLRIAVSDKEERPVRRLEPVMNAFAHLVGFYDDGRTVVHLHPAGSEVTDTAARGGPALEFRFYPPAEGFIRLYCQVCVDGKMVFARFNVNVIP